MRHNTGDLPSEASQHITLLHIFLNFSQYKQFKFAANVMYYQPLVSLFRSIVGWGFFLLAFLGFFCVSFRGLGYIFTKASKT